KKWPIVVALEGAGCVWMNTAGPFGQARGERPFAVVVPHTVSNTLETDRPHWTYDDDAWKAIERDGRDVFDRDGLLAVIDDARAFVQGGDTVSLPFFSGGGIRGWRIVLAHRELFAAVAPACANFWSGEASSAAERAALPIHAFQGERDPARDQLEP